MIRLNLMRKLKFDFSCSTILKDKDLLQKAL